MFPKILSNLSIAITYFRRGHTAWLAFGLSVTNFLVIQYTLLIERIPWLKLLFPSLEYFVLSTISFYVPLAIFKYQQLEKSMSKFNYPET